MARGNFLTKDIKGLIAKVYLEHPEWRTCKIREEVINQYHGVSSNYDNPNWPGISIVQKELANIRRQDNERSPRSKKMDGLWSIATLVEYDIFPLAMQKVVQIQNLRRNAEKPLTIREARWVSRLHTLTTDIKELGILSIFYALRERICELISTPDDTFHIDDLVLKYPVGATAILFSKFMKDSQAKDLSSAVLQLEDLLGLNLERPDFTGISWFIYGVLLMSVIEKEREKKEDTRPSEEELMNTVLDIRDMARICVDGLGMGMLPALQSITEELYGGKNERTHTSKG